MRLGGTARYLADIDSQSALIEALQWAAQKSVQVIMIGSGSNIVWQDTGYEGLVLVNKMMGYSTDELTDDRVAVTVAGGEPWDAVVARTVSEGLTGIEALSLVPGTTGGTPVQNVGAYGQEMSQVISEVHAIDNQTGQTVALTAADCDFGYRSSRFKTVDRGRYFITAITMHLQRGMPQPPYYPALEQYLDEHSVSNPSALEIRQAVIAIRSAKLPDPAFVANSGSFFANPIIDQAQLAVAQTAATSAVPQWPTKEGLIKIPAAWLIEQTGFKDFHDIATGMGTWPLQPLVLVNEAATSTADLLAFRNKIMDAVQQKFGITLQQEPELLP